MQCWEKYQRHSTERKKPDTKEHMLHDPSIKNALKSESRSTWRFGAMNTTEHFKVVETVSSIAVMSAYNCMYLSKHIELCLKMVLLLHIGCTAKRDVEFNR